MKFTPFLLAPCVLLASCASIVSKSDYPITISSQPSGCKVLVKNSEGQAVASTVTPSTITLPSSKGYFRPERYTFEFTQKNGKKQIVELNATINGWYFGNIVFGGLIGMVIVDPLTGAMWRLDEAVSADFTPMATVDNGHGKKVTFVDRSSLPANLQKQLVSLR